MSKTKLKWKEDPLLGEFAGTEFDPTVPWSFYKLLPPQSVEVMERIDKQMFRKSEDELDVYCRPTADLSRVRIAFQRAFHEAKEMRKPVINWHTVSEESDISMRVMQDMFTDKKKLLWILCPIVKVHRRMEGIYYEALRKMEQVLQAPMLLPDGTVDTKTFNAVNKVWSHLDKRQFGEFKQSIEVTDKTEKQPKHLEDVEAEIADIEKRLADLGHTEDVKQIEHTPQEETLHDQLESQARERGLALKVKKA